MGVPKFYRWVSERWPLINQIIQDKVTVIPEYDNLYLDMNGIIHNCSHPSSEEGNVHFRLTEHEMFVAIMEYIDKLFYIIRPRKLIYLAIDGVAPRAKMNQQRQRRFRSAKEMKEAIEAAIASGEKLPSQEAFDSNCITPGTEFMAKLSVQLEYYVRKKVREEPLWKGVKVVYSGHEVPGEGEHKIIEYIRHQKAQPDFVPGERHCMYGLDADLMFLALVTHEPNFSLLREVVVFKSPPRQSRNGGPPPAEVTPIKKNEFQMLHISIFRNYIDREFQQELPFGYDLERIIDDLVFMCFFVGNDFLPHLPSMDIREKSLDHVFNTYKEVVPTLGGYLTDCGTMDLQRVQSFCAHLAQFEEAQMTQIELDLAAFESKMAGGGRGRGTKSLGGVQPGDWECPKCQASVFASKQKCFKCGELRPTNATLTGWNANAGPVEKEAIAAGPEGGSGFGARGVKIAQNPYSTAQPAAPAEQGAPAEFASVSEALYGKPTEADILMAEKDETDIVAFFTDEVYDGDLDYKAKYYKKKFGNDVNEMEQEDIDTLVKDYVEGLAWVLHYYYDGVPSWKWYFPNYYAPMLGDLTDITKLNLEFELGEPFLPLQQLMGVLPLDSAKRFLPPAFKDIMASDAMAGQYPEDFEIDREGCKNPWEGVVKLPFLDEDRMLTALKSLPAGSLSAAEEARNRLSKPRMIRHDPQAQGKVASPMPGTLPDLAPALSSCRAWSDPAYDTTIKVFKCTFEQAQQQKAPGFPVIDQLNCTHETFDAHINIFGNPSRNVSTILRPQNSNEAPGDLNELAEAWLGKACFTNWPFLTEAMVVGISDGTNRVRDLEKGSTRESGNDYERDSAEVRGAWMNRGIDIGTSHVLFYVRLFEGMRFTGNGAYKKQYQEAETCVPFQMVLRPSRTFAFDPRFTEAKTPTLEVAFPIGDQVLYCGNPGFGSLGEIDGHGKDKTVSLTIAPEAPDTLFGRKIVEIENNQYVDSYAAAKMLKMSTKVLGMVSGSIYASYSTDPLTAVPGGKADLGLRMKFSSKELVVVGYVRKQDDTWQYSQLAIKAIAEYKKDFPRLFHFIEHAENAKSYMMCDIFPEAPEHEMLQQINAWKKDKALAKLSLSACTRIVLSPQAIHAVEKAANAFEAKSAQCRAKSKQVEGAKPQHIIKPMRQMCAPRSVAFALGDRVICVRDDSPVPFGARGTVVGFVDTLVEVLLDRAVLGASNLNGRCTHMRGCSLPMTFFLNLSPKKKEGAPAEGKSNAAKSTRGKQPQQQSNKFPHKTTPNTLSAEQRKHFEARKTLVPPRPKHEFKPAAPRATVQYSEQNQYSAVTAPDDDDDLEEVINVVPVAKPKPKAKRTVHPAQQKKAAAMQAGILPQPLPQQAHRTLTRAGSGVADQHGEEMIEKLAAMMGGASLAPAQGAPHVVAPPPQPLFAMMPPPIPMAMPGPMGQPPLVPQMTPEQHMMMQQMMAMQHRAPAMPPAPPGAAPAESAQDDSK